MPSGVSEALEREQSATQALEAIREAGSRGRSFVMDADIQGYFGNIERNTLVELVKERISDRRVLKLIRQWLESGVMEDGTHGLQGLHGNGPALMAGTAP